MSGQPAIGDPVRILAPWPEDGRTADVGAVGRVLYPPMPALNFWLVQLPDRLVALASAVEPVGSESA